LATWKGIAGTYDRARFNAIQQIRTFQDGRYIASTSDSGVRLWDAETHELIGLIGYETGSFPMIEVTTDGRRLAAVSLGNPRGVHLWSLDWPSSVDEPTSGDAAALSATISPNPLSDAFTILLAPPSAMPVSVVVVDPLGRQVFAGHDLPDRSGRMTVELPPLASGIYLCVIECGARRYVKTIEIID
jgi:hypothetical protein